MWLPSSLLSLKYFVVKVKNTIKEYVSQKTNGMPFFKILHFPGISKFLFLPSLNSLTGDVFSGKLFLNHLKYSIL